TEPSVKGATAAAQYKPATLETGLKITVPPFVKIGETVAVDTPNGEYLSRPKKGVGRDRRPRAVTNICRGLSRAISIATHIGPVCIALLVTVGATQQRSNSPFRQVMTHAAGAGALLLITSQRGGAAWGQQIHA